MNTKRINIKKREGTSNILIENQPISAHHQLSEGDEVDRGHGLAASLLLLLALLLRRAGRLQQDQVKEDQAE